MSDLISKQAVINVLEGRIRANGYSNVALAPELNQSIRYLMRLPSAESEIIQCKDCKHLLKWRSEESAKKFGQLYECGKDILMNPALKDFCSKAESRDEDEDNN